VGYHKDSLLRLFAPFFLIGGGIWAVIIGGLDLLFDILPRLTNSGDWLVMILGAVSVGGGFVISWRRGSPPRY